MVVFTTASSELPADPKDRRAGSHGFVDKISSRCGIGVLCGELFFLNER